MSIFKKKIYFPQFLADLITSQFDFLEKNSDKLIVLADESKILTEKDKEELLDKSHELIIVDIMMSCSQHFYKHLSSEDAGEAISIVYAKYLTEHKRVSKTIAERKLEKVVELFELVSEAEQNIHKRDEHYKEIGHNSHPKIGSDIYKQKFYICSGFSNYCAGKDMKAVNWEGKHFAAFKLAKGFVVGNIFSHALKHYTVTF